MDFSFQIRTITIRSERKKIRNPFFVADFDTPEVGLSLVGVQEVHDSGRPKVDVEHPAPLGVI